MVQSMNTKVDYTVAATSYPGDGELWEGDDRRQGI